jgi:hypothetical protein
MRVSCFAERGEREEEGWRSRDARGEERESNFFLV